MAENQADSQSDFDVEALRANDESAWMRFFEEFDPLITSAYISRGRNVRAFRQLSIRPDNAVPNFSQNVNMSTKSYSEEDLWAYVHGETPIRGLPRNRHYRMIAHPPRPKNRSVRRIRTSPMACKATWTMTTRVLTACGRHGAVLDEPF
jgi:hypothetical protein